MDLNFLTNGITGALSKKVLIWTIGGAVSIFVAAQIKKFLNTMTENAIRKIKGEIANIEDENLREAARHVVRYVATQMPNENGNAKLDEAIRVLQEITPDILVSDDKLKVIIESAYTDFKNELKSI